MSRASSRLAPFFVLLCTVGQSCGDERAASEAVQPAPPDARSTRSASPEEPLAPLAPQGRRPIPGAAPAVLASSAGVASVETDPEPERFGALRGRVRALDGTPTAGLELVLLPADLEVTEPFLHMGDSDVPSPGVARWRAIACTDAHGRFEVEELGRTSWNVYARLHSSTGRSGVHPLTLRPVLLDGPDVELVWSRPRMVVRVQEGTGAPWTGASGRLEGRVPSDGAKSPEVRLLVYPVADPPHEDFDPWRRPLSGTSVEPGLVAFDVREGRQYLVGLFGKGQSWEPLRVTVPPGPGNLEVPRLVLDQGNGELEVLCPSEEPVRLSLRDPRSGVELMTWNRTQGGSFRLSLPEGEYTVQVDDLIISFCGVGGPPPRTHAPFEANVRVRKSETTTLRATYPAGGRLHLRLLGEVREQDRLAVQTERSDLHPMFAADLLAPRLCLAREGRVLSVLEFRDANAWNGLRRAPAFGAEATSELLPAGRFTLHARMPGGRVASVPVLLVDGQTTEATLRID